MIADRYTGRLLPAMLQRVEAEVRQPSDVLARCVHGEHPAGFLGVLGAIV